jgi:glycosyltransferase involved in cell wall biosynthesis
MEFILIDDFSDDLPHFETCGLNIRLFRIDTDIAWNQAGARNLAALHVSGEWACFFDIDQIFNIDSAGVLLANLDGLDRKTMYLLKSREIIRNDIDGTTHEFHISSFLVRMEQFRTMGMYDEDFTGYYGYEDVYFHFIWIANGGSRILLNRPAFFDGEQDFRTTDLDRDLGRNATLMNRKVAEWRQSPGPRTARNLIRFAWHEVALNAGPSPLAHPDASAAAASDKQEMSV